MTLSRGRDLLAIPGPSVIPDRVLRAMHRAAPNIYEGDLVTMTETIFADLRRVAGTSGHVCTYIGNGHAVWEAAVANLFAPGDVVLVLTTGRFGAGWAATAGQMGITVETLDFGFRAPADPARLTERLAEDRDHRIRAVLTVQTDTASSVCNDIAALRDAIDAASHPALFCVDCIASLGCEPFAMDALGVDVMVAACQKGLMVPPGVAFTFHTDRATAAAVRCPSPYWDWAPRTKPGAFYNYFCGTAPTHHLFGLRESLDMIFDEGLEAVWSRHHRFARAVAAAVEIWGARGAMELNIADPVTRSRAVTTVRTEPGLADRLRAWCAGTAGLTLGVGLSGPDQDPARLFRIGHMGHVNPPMLLGALATIEAGLGALGVDRDPGAIEAAAAIIAAP